MSLKLIADWKQQSDCKAMTLINNPDNQIFRPFQSVDYFIDSSIDSEGLISNVIGINILP